MEKEAIHRTIQAIKDNHRTLLLVAIAAMQIFIIWKLEDVHETSFSAYMQAKDCENSTWAIRKEIEKIDEKLTRSFILNGFK